MKMDSIKIRTLFLSMVLTGAGIVSAQSTTASTDAVAVQQQANPEIEALKKQIAANPQDTEALAKLGTAYQNVKDWPAAVDTWKKLSALLPDWAPAYYSQAYSYQSANDLGNAKTAYEKYISTVKPTEVEANKQNLAYAYFFLAYSDYQSNPEKAKQYIAKSLEYDPSNADAVNLSKVMNS